MSHRVHHQAYSPACCPEPHRLRDGLAGGLRLAHESGAQTMAVAAMGTGEGGVQPDQCARMFIGAARDFFREEPDSPLTVQFCLPTYRDYEAFERTLSAP